MRLEEFLNSVPKTTVGERRVAEYDEIRVGPILITSYGKESAGIWIDRGPSKSMIAIFSVPGQVGIGVYGPDAIQGPCDVCLYVDEQGSGTIQFSNAKGELQSLGFDEVKKLLEAK